MKTVFFDVDTQLDFMYPSGALYVAGAEKIVEQIAALNRFAGAEGIPLISTTDAHAENDPEFQGVAAALRCRLHWPAQAGGDPLEPAHSRAKYAERR